jgi:signal transduction histidine kinase
MLPIGLVVLIVLLAMLQYRWLGQVSESERQDLRHSFERRAQDFAAEADNESGGLYQAFTSLVDGSDDQLATEIGTHLGTWQKANRYPALVRALFVIRARGPHDTVLRFDPARVTLDEMPTPPEIAPVFDRLRFGVSGTVRRGEQSFTQVATIGGSSFISRVPARLVWLWPKDWPSAAGAPIFPPIVGNVVVRAPLTERILLIQLDRTVMAQAMLPAMLVNHFGEGPRTGTSPEGPHPNALPPRLYERGSAVRLQVVDAENTIVVAAGMRPGESFAADRADVTAPFFGTEDTWHLLVQHGAGSVDQAVAITRRRNLYVSAGILSVLVVAMGLVVGNARRTERLATQQMEFVATVSHELRTPIAVIRSAAENLASGIVQELPQAKQYGEVIEAEGQRLTDMVEQVLEHASIRATRVARRRVDVDVRDLVRDAVHACEPMTLNAGIMVDVEVSPDLPHLPADEPALRRALENLIGNAVKHAGAGRWIGVTARLAPNDARAVDRRPGRTARPRPLPIVDISVSDRGPGVSRDERGRIFEAFYRGRLALDRQVPGTGLGLSLVKRVVEDHGGWVEIETTTGGGATFSMRLPVLPDPDVASAAGDA